MESFNIRPEAAQSRLPTRMAKVTDQSLTETVNQDLALGQRGRRLCTLGPIETFAGLLSIRYQTGLSLCGSMLCPNVKGQLD